MNVETVISIISSVGFPIAACIFMATRMQKSMDTLSNVVKGNTDVLADIKTMINTAL